MTLENMKLMALTATSSSSSSIKRLTDLLRARLDIIITIQNTLLPSSSFKRLYTLSTRFKNRMMHYTVGVILLAGFAIAAPAAVAQSGEQTVEARVCYGPPVS